MDWIELDRDKIRIEWSSTPHTQTHTQRNEESENIWNYRHPPKEMKRIEIKKSRPHRRYYVCILFIISIINYIYVVFHPKERLFISFAHVYNIYSALRMCVCVYSRYSFHRYILTIKWTYVCHNATNEMKWNEMKIFFSLLRVPINLIDCISVAVLTDELMALIFTCSSVVSCFGIYASRPNR